ncbi:NAD-dependent epimerase/dehydratase family protein [Streptomyces stelliscabiei]|uniref:Nucleoside-diphosphate-sugar epimerase n=1 Tax=Streptomyces stelliscabiei TaxID=146820 RepID=A0A8I0P1H4_9ACTN|nr:NAD(P)-dependent oxidoreductase [Streptomyces stelliscabiei]KND41861.1 epimerase [Streptomyces stelliscabiei]MBE1594539.1 nucleoside-diphosphate-sugar epimerase [Streptomyces stelliscabiei]MDX2518806.1 NAD(P)-dependent oxidoreductase [Streptomyces stelliscabiei]
MRVVVIGGSGHIGTYLVPRLVRAGHEVINVSRGSSTAYTDAPEWQQVRQVVADRQREDAAGTFGRTVAGPAPDAVIDLVCFTLESATALVEGLRGETGHLLHCGSVWRYGPSLRLPISEGTGPAPIGEYGVQKDLIARMLKDETASGGLTTTSLHPGHIVGPGWHPIGPLGNLDPAIWTVLSAGQPLRIPGSGAEMMHHVHADDVAQAFELAIEHRDTAAGEDFNIVAPTALNVRGFAHIAAAWFGQTATLEPVTWDQFRQTAPPQHAEQSWDHLHRSHCLTIEKARTLLHYTPRYEPEVAVLESVRWLIEHGELDVAGPLVA